MVKILTVIRASDADILSRNKISYRIKVLLKKLFLRPGKPGRRNVKMSKTRLLVAANCPDITIGGLSGFVDVTVVEKDVPGERGIEDGGSRGPVEERFAMD
jgi:hypothetical protein